MSKFDRNTYSDKKVRQVRQTNMTIIILLNKQ